MNKAVTIFMSIVALVAIAVIGVDTMLQLEQFNIKKHTYQTGIYEVCNNPECRIHGENNKVFNPKPTYVPQVVEQKPITVQAIPQPVPQVVQVHPQQPVVVVQPNQEAVQPEVVQAPAVEQAP